MLDSHTTVTDNFNPQQPKGRNAMPETRLEYLERARREHTPVGDLGLTPAEALEERRLRSRLYTPNPQQPKVNHMQDFEQQAIMRAVDALEAIAEHMGVLATMALSNSTAPAVETQPKRKPGRPRKDATVHMVGTPAPEAPAAPAAEPAPPAPVVSEAERAEAFGKLKSALKECLALHGEEVARQRLQFPKFSEVPYEAIPATIERLAA